MDKGGRGRGLRDRKGLASMDSWRQTIELQFDSAVVIVVQISNQFCLEMLHRIKALQIEQL